MREIKFRAWGKSERMIPWSELCGLHASTIFQHVEGYYLMQYTGLKDKNGKEIYEGDVLEKKQGSSTFKYNVMFYAGSFGVELPPPSYEYRPFCDLPMANYEVIGNIYQHPELIRS